MSILGAVVNWDVDRPAVGRLGSLLTGLPARSPDGRWFVRAPGCVLGIGLRATGLADRTDARPLADSRRKLYAVGDVRIDNRADLQDELQGQSAPRLSDLGLIVAGYERWRHRVVEKLIGDFAFVIWDERERRVFAARDAFGTRPLVYRSTSNELVLATDVAQLLALPDFERVPDDRTVVEYLSWSFTRYGPTFFRGVRSLPPGHFLVASRHSIREVGFFSPPTEEVRYARREDYYEHFRDLFVRGVQDRLESDYPILAHLSGGLDSSSIVCAADAIYRRGDRARPPFLAVSAEFPGERHDERQFVDMVARAVRFDVRHWNGNVPSGRELSHPALGIPGTSVSFNGGSAGDVEIAAAVGARVLLTGDLGDYVTGEIGLFHDLLARLRWWSLAKAIMEASSDHGRSARIRLLKTAVREELPTPVVALWDLKNRRPSGPPPWLQPALHPLWVERRTPVPSRSGRWLNRLQRGAWTLLTVPNSAWSLDFRASYAASAGMEVRYPLLDSRLVRFILSIPVEHRIPGGLLRWFHRQALSPLLPPAIANRESKPNFTGAVVRWGHASLPVLHDWIAGPVWKSGRFILQNEAGRLLDRVASRPRDPSDWVGWRNVRAIVNIEAWHRAILAYAGDEEKEPMTEVRDPFVTESTGEGDNESRFSAYVAPRLTPIGNVRDLLATGVVSTTDSPGDPSQGQA